MRYTVHIHYPRSMARSVIEEAVGSHFRIRAVGSMDLAVDGLTLEDAQKMVTVLTVQPGVLANIGKAGIYKDRRETHPYGC